MKTKLFSLSPRILIIIYILIALVVAFFIFKSHKSHIEERKQLVFQELNTLSDLKAKRLQTWQNERLGDAGILMKSTGFISIYNNWLQNPDNESNKKIVLNWLSAYDNYFNYKNIILLDDKQNVKLTLNGNISSLDNISLANFNQSIAEKKPNISNLYISDSDSTINLDIASPFFNEDRLVGGIILRIDPNDFIYPEVNYWPVISKTSESVLFTVDGNNVVFLNNLRFKENTALKYKLKIDSANSHFNIINAAKGLRGISEGIDYKGSKTLNYTRQIENSPWIMINKIDYDEIYEPVIDKTISQIIIFGFIFILFGAGLVWIWHNRIKTLQIQKLEEEKRILGIARNYEKVMKYANVAMILSDNDLVIRDVNERALSLYGFSKNEIIGMKISDFVASEAEQIPDGNKDVEEKLKEGIIYESLQKRKDNSIFYADINLSIVEINGRNFYHRIISDITQRKIAAEKLRQSKEHLQELNSEKDKFFSIIAHDLREPLGSFMNVTKMMDESKSSMTEEEIDEYVRLMKDSSANLYGLLENLLEWSTMKRGLIAIKPGLINLKKCLSKNLEIIKESADRKNLDFSVNIPDDIDVFADERMVNGIIRNLGTNAVKFTPKGGKIIVNAEYSDNDEVLISICDSGIGIPSKMIDNLFDSTVNTKRPGTDGEPSSGLGLILCKEFTEKLGGRLIIESESGKGSTFKIFLPGKEPQQSQPAEEVNRVISDTIFEQK